MKKLIAAMNMTIDGYCDPTSGMALKQSPGERDIFVCSSSLIVQTTKPGLVDEYLLCIHPVMEGSGLRLF